MLNKLFYTGSIATLIIMGLFLYKEEKPQNNPNIAGLATSNVEVTDKNQVIKITAKGGYFPKNITAQADIPTKLVITTPGTYDCSVALLIPKINFNKILPTKGSTEIELGSRSVGEKINGTCSMGMYSFNINFQ